MQKRQKGFNLVRHGELVIGQLYDTKVCIIDRGTRTIEFHTGGFWTRATLKAMNATLRAALEPFQIRGKLQDCELILEPYNDGAKLVNGGDGGFIFEFKNGETYAVYGVDNASGFETTLGNAAVACQRGA